jgi:hypothetical protein
LDVEGVKVSALKPEEEEKDFWKRSLWCSGRRGSSSSSS